MITRPELRIFFKSISSPIMNSSRINPSREITSIDSRLFTNPTPNGPTKNPAAKYARINGCLHNCAAIPTSQAAMTQIARSIRT